MVSPSVEGQFSISYMRRQAAVQLFINASILVLKTALWRQWLRADSGLS